MHELFTQPGRCVFHVAGGQEHPACYLIQDREAGGILVNTPPFDNSVLEHLQQAGGVDHIFLPSHLGALDLDRWRDRLQARSLAWEAELRHIDGTIDIGIGRKTRLTRTIDFLPMSGRTEGSCALRLRNLPGAIFFGPILSPGASGWPGLHAREDDYSYENRLIGVLGLQDLKYAYAFTDVFIPGQTRYGPGADQAIQRELQALLAD